MKKIKLTRGLFALVDDEDFDFLNQWKWHAIKDRNRFYAFRQGKNRKRILMHKEILKISKEGNIVDHINLDTLNNQKNNLRECSIAENNRNRLAYKNKAIKYKGVSFGYKGKKGQVYKSQICLNKKTTHLGCFYNEIDAAKAYDAAAIKHYGEFANINFPKNDES